MMKPEGGDSQHGCHHAAIVNGENSFDADIMSAVLN